VTSLRNTRRSRDQSPLLGHPSVYSCCLATVTCLPQGCVATFAARLSRRGKHRFVYCCIAAGTCFEVTILAWRKYATLYISNLSLIYRSLSITNLSNMSLINLSNLSIPVVPTWRIGHPWDATFHFSFLILDSRQDSLGRVSARRKAATYTNTDKHPCLEWDSNPRS
jgi:hypothetical protein